MGPLVLESGAKFRGTSKLSLDARGRLTVPSKYREALGFGDSPQLIVTLEKQARCLLLYRLEEWEETEEKLINLPDWDPKVASVKQVMLLHATEVEPDNHGRILIPPLLRERLVIDRQVYLSGYGNYFQIWEESAFEATISSALETVKGDLSESPELQKLSI